MNYVGPTMTEPVALENFDPYHKWLGISPKDQPPHHYRLLGVDLFESDADVISAAADKQMAFIRSFQTGKNASLSQKLLNEIAAARVCLLNAAKKSEYDGALRARMAAAGSQSGLKRAESLLVIAEAPVEEAPVVEAELADAEMQMPLPLQFGGGKRSQIRKKKSKKASFLPLAALGAMLVACVVAIAVVMSRTPETPVSQADANPDGRPPRDAEPARVKPATQDNKLPVPADSAKLAPPTIPLHPSRAGDSPDVPTPAKPPEGEEPATPNELDKQLADAKTAEDYQAVAGRALRAAGRAMDDHQQDAAKKLLLKALVAARKSHDLKLIVKATRALVEPESAKEILAEEDD